MDDDPLPPISDEASAETMPPHPAVLMIARLLGRQMAREAFKARQAANDNPPANANQ
jgi:hypothetical protein